MPTIERTFVEIEQWSAQINRLETSKRSLLRKNFADAESNMHQWIALDRQIFQCQESVRGLIRRHEQWPERFERHAEGLERLHEDGAFDDSVFVMTKYPGSDASPSAGELRHVIGTVTDVARRLGYRPRLASERSHHRWLWDNVELHLCGCARGIAIVEDRYLPELNPNVAMEWGWMVGMGRDVLFLRENGFSHDRADWGGLISEPFSWDDPDPGITAALTKFLPGRTATKGGKASE